MSETLLETRELSKSFNLRQGFFGGKKLKNIAVDRVSFSLGGGETLGLVGESGCGKSTLALTIMRLYESNGGRIFFAGEDITNLEEEKLKAVRKQMQMVFQDPFAALDQRLTIEQIIGEPLEIHNIGTKRERVNEVAHLLERVGLSSEDMRRFPNESSGGQQQRIGIARALALRPKLLICDEPVSALDVSVQAQVVNLLQDLQAEFGLTYLFISHGLAVVEHISNRVAVMYLGKIVEIADAQTLYENPLMPYTKALLSAIPVPDPKQKRERIVLQGDVPTPINPPSGCRFRTRCPWAIEECAHVVPELREIEPNHFAACIRIEGYENAPVKS